MAPASRQRFSPGISRRKPAVKTSAPQEILDVIAPNFRANHLNDNRIPKNQQRPLALVEKSRVAQMAPVRTLPHPNRPMVADSSLDNFIRDLSVAIDKECRQTCKYSALAKINLRAANFSSRQISSTPCFYLSTPLQSFVYRIAGVAHR